MNFRQLIEKAIHKARDEFAEVISRKLATLMGTDEAGEARRASGLPASDPQKKKAPPRDVRSTRFTVSPRPASSFRLLICPFRGRLGSL